MKNQNFVFKQFAIITLIVSIWINISEVLRYFVFVMPRMEIDASAVSTTSELAIYSIWWFWDTLLTAVLVFAFWLTAKSFDNTNKSVFISSFFIWTAVFVIYWVATANMGLSSWDMLLTTLPLSLLEMLIGAWLTSWLYSKNLWIS